MSTRRVGAGERHRQNGWASAPEFDALRGLNGTAVALKAALQDAPEKRELLYFLQALSLREGGLKRIARELVAMFPERIGTPTMLAIGCKPGKRLTKEQDRAIRAELPWVAEDDDFLDIILDRPVHEKSLSAPTEDSAAIFCGECREHAEQMDRFIEELCCDPKMEMASKSDSRWNYRERVETAPDAQDSLVGTARQFRCAELPYFHDALGALYEYQRRHTAQARDEYVETSITRIVCEAMDYVRDTGRSALIEGNSGFGKTSGLKAWCEINLGRARYVQLTGITPRTAFFRRLAKALGVANGGGMSSGKIQSRVEDFLQRTKLILVIDEGQYLWPQGKRIESHPELVNWLNTACYNEGVPFAISATKQFTLRRQAVEDSTDWSSEQSRRRTRKVFPLPDAPTEDDLKAVARKLLGELGENAVDLVVGYALTSRGYFQTITDAIEDAQLIAKRAGRERMSTKDLRAAIYEWRAPSDAALVRVFDSQPEGRRRQPGGGPLTVTQSAPVGPAITEPLNPHLMDRKSNFSSPEAVRRSTRPEAVPVLTG